MSVGSSLFKGVAPTVVRLYKSSAGMWLKGAIRGIQAEIDINTRQGIDEIVSSGINQLSKAEREQIRGVIEGQIKATGRVKEVADRIHATTARMGDEVLPGTRLVREIKQDESGNLKRTFSLRKQKESGWVTTPDGTVIKHVPHLLTDENAQILKHDTEAIFEIAKRSGATIGRTPTQIMQNQPLQLDKTSKTAVNMAFNRLAAHPKGLSKQMLDSMNHLMNKRKMTPAEAIIVINQRANGQIFDAFGTMRYARQWTLPDYLYEKDPYKIYERYVMDWAKTKAARKYFGENYKVFDDNFRQMSPDEQKVALHLVGNIMGRSFVRAPMGWVKTQKAIAKAEVFTKIGGGFTTLLNIPQLLYSTMAKAGVYKTIYGIARYAARPETRQMVRASGINNMNSNALHMFAGDMRDIPKFKNLDLEGKNLVEKIANLTFSAVMTPFNTINRINNALSAAVGEIYIEGLHRSVGRKGIWAKKNRAILEHLGINPDANLTKNELLKGMHNFASDMQLQRNLLDDPLWMNDPRFKVFGLFKRYGLRQFNFMRHSIINEEVRKGNVMPALRLAAAGYASGRFVLWARESIDKGLGGNPDRWSDEDRSNLVQVINAISASGALGNMTDLVRGIKGKNFYEDAGRVLSNVSFSAIPVVMAEITGIPGNYSQQGWLGFAQDILRRMEEDNDIPDDLLLRVGGQISPVVRNIQQAQANTGGAKPAIQIKSARRGGRKRRRGVKRIVDKE